MKSQLSFTDLEYGNRKKRTKRDEFLEAMDTIIVWEEWTGLVAPYYFGLVKKSAVLSQNS